MRRRRVVRGGRRAAGMHMTQCLPHAACRHCLLLLRCRCYSEATEAMTADQLAEPWHTAFKHDDPASGGCPPAVEADDRN